MYWKVGTNESFVVVFVFLLLWFRLLLLLLYGEVRDALCGWERRHFCCCSQYEMFLLLFLIRLYPTQEYI